MDDFYRQNSADEDKKLAASLVGDRYFPQHASPALLIRYEAVSDLVAYVGEAAPDTATSDAEWRIKRVNTTSNGDVVVLYANSTATFDKVWDDRASYIY